MSGQRWPLKILIVKKHYYLTEFVCVCVCMGALLYLH